MDMITSKLITVADVCSATRLGKTKIYELINEGTLVSHKIGRRTLIAVESVERLINCSRVSQEVGDSGRDGEAM